MIEAIQLTVIGEEKMHCNGCEKRACTVLQRLPGVEAVSASVATQQIDIRFDPSLVRVEQLQAKLDQAGYVTAPVGGKV